MRVVNGRALLSRWVIAVVVVAGMFGIASAAGAEVARIALVIGNAAYDGDAALQNPVNDATDVAASLRQVGWTVTLVTDADRRAFNRAIAGFRTL